MKTIVITGASGGIGAAIARHLGRQDNRLVLAARRIAELNAVAGDSGPNTVTVRADVTKRDDVNRIRDEALRAFETVDVWINNVGRGISKPAMELTDEDVDEMMAINVKSALYGAQAIVPHFLQRGRGHLVNISSFLGRVPLATHRSAYNAAKAALNALTANLRVDLRRQNPNIHVSIVMPGLVSTDFAKNVRGQPSAFAPPWTPGGGGPQPGMKPQTADEVAAAVADLIEKPVAELFTNPASPELARRYFADVDAFESGM